MFRPDKPVSTETEDYFQRYNFAGRIASIINNTKNGKSVVIGLYGKWGEGKSSVLNFIERQLNQNTVFISFNPWRFQDENQLIKYFFTSVASALGKKLPSKKKDAYKLFSDYGTSLSAYVPMLLKPFISIASSYARKASEDTLEDQKGRIEEFIVSANTNIVISIDDIDRLDSKEIQLVFKLVKLSGDFPRFSYILAFDNELVASSLGQHFGDGSQQSGYDFLEKIIQVPLHLPAADGSALRQFSLDLLNGAIDANNIDVSEAETKEFLSMYDNAFVPGLKNPRLGIRAANAVGFALPLLYKEVNTSDLLIIECIKVFYPDLYAAIKTNGKLFLTNYQSENISSRKQNDIIKQEAKEAISAILRPYGDYLGEKIKDMLCDLFPLLQILYQNTHYPESFWKKWYQEKRICSTYYFNRYFSYVVRKGEISDVYFEELLADATKHNTEFTANRLREELSKNNVSDFVFKLRFQCEKFSPAIAESLIVPLAMIGSALPDIPGFTITTPKRDVSITIKELIVKTDISTRYSNAEKAITAATPYEFSLEIYRQFLYTSERHQEEEFLTKDEQLQLSRVMIGKFQSVIRQTYFASLPDTLLMRTFGVYHFLNDYASVTPLLLDALSSGNGIERVISMFSPTITSTSEPQAYKTNMDDAGYDFMAKFIDPAIVFEASVNAHGNLSSSAKAPEPGEKINRQQMIAIFQKIHLSRVNQEENDRALAEIPIPLPATKPAE